MNIIYFNYPEGTEKLSFTVTDKTVDDLKAIGVIPQTSKTVVKDFEEEQKSPENVMHTIHVDKLVFDDNDNPTDVVFDLDLVRDFYIDSYRKMREKALELLDGYQMSAFARGRTELSKLIENDKQVLRDMVENMNFSEAKTAFEVSRVYPAALMIDYKSKYKPYIKKNKSILNYRIRKVGERKFIFSLNNSNINESVVTNILIERNNDPIISSIDISQDVDGILKQFQAIIPDSVITDDGLVVSTDYLSIDVVVAI